MYSKFKDNRNFKRLVQKKGDESDLCELKISLVYTFSSRTPSLSQKTLCVCEGGIFTLCFSFKCTKWCFGIQMHLLSAVNFYV